jgi:hypothetical protein
MPATATDLGLSLPERLQYALGCAADAPTLDPEERILWDRVVMALIDHARAIEARKGCSP